MATAQDIALLDRSQPFAAQCAALGMKLAAEQVYVLAHWITDRDLPKRFDVPFLVARMPEGQTPVADESEQFEPVWVRPADALKRHEARDFFIIFPTIRTLQRLTPFADVQAVLDACAVNDEPLWTSCPRAGWLAGKEERYMEHDSPYGELALTSPDGQIVHHLDWQSQHPVALLKNVQRLTAPNPGVMTGPGTNTYWVGDPHGGYIVIDPGPADPDHLERIWRATGGQIRMIVCTHSHPDHSPGAKPLQSLCKGQAGGVPPILGLSSASTANAQSQFKPDRELAHGEILKVGEHSLKVLHTPGHAANHLCLALLEDGLLFSGDHVLNGSTTVVNPPDGNMNDYLDSLDLLADECKSHQLEFIMPAHGYVLGFAAQAIAQLKAHRLKREAKVISAMRALPHGTLEEWVAHAYDDVPERLWPVAARSLQAHVDRIQSMPPGNN
jgi:glyoxylase-like metal-dependent hydrolase (beta-lactamase superfamily II)